MSRTEEEEDEEGREADEEGRPEELNGGPTVAEGEGGRRRRSCRQGRG